MTITRACFQLDHSRRAITQNILSGQLTLGRESRRLKANNCWRKAKFSSSRFFLEEKERRNSPIRSFSKQNMVNLYILGHVPKACAKLLFSRADLSFGEGQINCV